MTGPGPADGGGRGGRLVIGLTPAALGGAVAGWPIGVQVVAGLAGGAVLLAVLGLAQWSVLRRLVPRSARWIGWTAGGWLAGLAVFAAITTPLWQPGQDPVVVALVGIVGGCTMAATVAAVTGWGFVRILDVGDPAIPRVGTPAPQEPAPWALPAEQVAAALGVDPVTGLDDAPRRRPPVGCSRRRCCATTPTPRVRVRAAQRGRRTPRPRWCGRP